MAAACGFVWSWPRLLGGGLAWRHAKEVRKGEAARQQVLTALRITNHALNEMNARLAAHGHADQRVRTRSKETPNEEPHRNFHLGSSRAGRARCWRKPRRCPCRPPLKRQLAARASNVTEVTLGKNMLAFAAKFMNGKDKDDAAARQLIEGLDGIYVREYEFDKEGQYSMEEIKQLRASFETSEWSSIVRERERKSGETTDVMVKMVNGESRGMFILSAEPKELTIVLILGPIRMDELGELKGLGGLGALGDIEKNAEDKDKEKTKTGGDQ